MRWNTSFMRGIGKRNERFVILLDVDRIFSDTEIDQVMGVAEAAEPA
jgi:purine-binding chemotaxis protein CheW